MGGRGSGRPAGFGLTADLCHEFHSIDLTWLRRNKLMVLGHWSSLNWSVRGQPTGSIQLAYVPGGIRLNYRQRQRGGEWHPVDELVLIVETATAFSGRRQWFQCLGCARRCRILYGGAYFRCRRCQGLRYDTQYEPPFARAATRALKIRERLGSKGGIDDRFPEKPKRMHWKTYERLQDEAERYEAAWAVGIAGKFRLADL